MKPQKHMSPSADLPLSDIVDLHSHILPGMDDGAADAEVTRAMLDRMAEQGVRHLVSTSHFYPEDEAPEEFLRRRTEAARLLRTVYDPERHPTLYVGAEVAFFSGISRSDSMKKLCILGTDSILVEMPQRRWTSEVVRELLMMPFQLGLFPIVAHMERCLPLQPRGTDRLLLDNGVRLQTNAEHVLHKKTAKGALKDIARGHIAYLGSDAHGIEHRPPSLGPALQLLAERTDASVLERLARSSHALTATAVPLLQTL